MRPETYGIYATLDNVSKRIDPLASVSESNQLRLALRSRYWTGKDSEFRSTLTGRFEWHHAIEKSERSRVEPSA